MPVPAEPGALGQVLLGEGGRAAQPAEQIAKRGRALAHRRPAWFHALADQGRMSAVWRKRTTRPERGGGMRARCGRAAHVQGTEPGGC